MQSAKCRIREKGKPIYIFLTGNPLVPYPSSLKLNISLGEAEDENKTAVRRFFRCWASEEFYAKYSNHKYIPP